MGRFLEHSVEDLFFIGLALFLATLDLSLGISVHAIRVVCGGCYGLARQRLLIPQHLAVLSAGLISHIIMKCYSTFTDFASILGALPFFVSGGGGGGETEGVTVFPLIGEPSG